MPRPTPGDPWTEAPTRDVLGLSVLGLNADEDAALIEARNTLYKWITACTQAMLWDVHSEKDESLKVEYGANWGKIGQTRRQFLVDTYRHKVLSLPLVKPVVFLPNSVETTSAPGGSRGSTVKPRSIFEDDWPIQKMLREALKNERDGRREDHVWAGLVQTAQSKMDDGGRPLVGNSILRIWRETRLSHTIARTQSVVWDTTPHPEPVIEDTNHDVTASQGAERASQDSRLGLERFSEELEELVPQELAPE